MTKNEEIDFRDRKLLFMDLETTGLDFNRHEIIEIGCLLVDGRSLKVIDEYSARVKPEHIQTASKKGLKVAGYSKKKWKDALPLKEVLKEVVKFAPEAMVAGWKVDFDWWFLDVNLKKLGVKHGFDYHLIDVISIAYIYLRSQKKPKKLNLRSVARSLGISVDEQHSAMTDIRATYEVFKKLIEDEI